MGGGGGGLSFFTPTNCRVLLLVRRHHFLGILSLRFKSELKHHAAINNLLIHWVGFASSFMIVARTWLDSFCN